MKKLSLALTALILAFSIQNAFADEFEIIIKGNEINHLAAMDIELVVEPNKTTRLLEDFNLHQKISEGDMKVDVLFKSVDSDHNSIKLFFTDKYNSDVLKVSGKIDRLNYSGPINVKIKGTQLVSDFGYDLDSRHIQSDIKITKVDTKLPYMGVENADILGPNPRIFTKSMFIAIGNIETYGFKLDESIEAISINGNKASIINASMIAAYLPLTDMPERNELELELIFDTDSKQIRKTIGPLKLLDSVELR